MHIVWSNAKFILSIATLVAFMFTSCKSMMRTPRTTLHAVSDGRLTLGVVPSKGSDGSQAYRLLVCKKVGNFQPHMFNDNRLCRAGLVNDKGQEVVLLHNQLRRSFATKYQHYIVGGVGAVLLALGITAGVKFFPKSSKYVDNLADSADVARAEQVAKLRAAFTDTDDEELRKVLLRFEELQTKQATTTTNIKALQKEMQRAVQSADPARVNEVIARVRQVDKNLGDELQSRLLTNSHIDVDSIERIAREAEVTDIIYAQRLRALQQGAPLEIGDNGLQFYKGQYEFQKVGGTFANPEGDTLKTVIDRSLAEGRVHEVNDFGLSIMRTTSVHGQSYRDALELRYLERRKQQIFDVLDGKTVDESALQAEIDTKFMSSFVKIEKKYKAVKMHDDSFWQNASYDKVFFKKFSDELGIEYDYFDGVEKYHDMLLKRELLNLHSGMQAGKVDLVDELRSIDAELGQAVVKLIATDNNGMRVAKANIDNIINAAQIPQEEKDVIINFAKNLKGVDNEEEFWKNISILNQNAAEATPENITALRNEVIDRLKQKVTLIEEEIVRINDKKISTGDLSPQKQQELNNYLSELENLKKEEQEIFAKYGEVIDAAAQKNPEKVEQLRQEMQNKKFSLGGLASLGGIVVGAGTVVAGIDESIWGYGEEQLNDYWNQIFNDTGSFDDAVHVQDLEGVLRKLADTFRQQVNTSALFR